MTTRLTPEDLSMVVGDWQRTHLRAQATWKDAVEIAVSTGSCSMNYRLLPTDCRRLARWLNMWADRIDRES